MDYPVGSRIQDRYEVFRVLQGGLGRVYLVYDHAVRVPLAVKTFLGDQAGSAEAVDRFRQESFVWTQLDRHPNVVAAERFEVINGRPYLFLEYVAGGDLAQWIGTPWLTLERILLLCLQFCDGMIHAAARGLTVHRDIKPDNCMMSANGLCLKITDFGLAKVADSSGLEACRRDEAFSSWLSDTLQGKTSGPPPVVQGTVGAFGTATFMPPEQWQDAASVDVRADVYSFGVMLYLLLQGELPFQADNFSALCYQHFAAAPPKLRLDHPLGPVLDELVGHCLAKAPADRPPDFLAVRGRLAELFTRLTDRPPPAPVSGEALTAADLNDKAACLLNMRLYPEALDLLGQALSLKRDLREAWINRAACLRHLRRERESVESCEQALRLGQCSPAWSELGMALGRLSDPRAEDSFLRALECDPHDPLVWNNLGLYRAGSGKLTEALECFTRAIEIAPNRAALWIGRGMTCFNLGQLEEAAGCFEQCLALDEQNPSAWEYLGRCLWELGSRERAQPYFERALKLAPNSASAWLDLGRCYVARRLYEEALPLLERALELDASQQLGWYVLGSAQMMLGRYAESIPALDRAVELDPGDGDAWFNRGQALLQLKRKPEARHSFERAHAVGHPQAAGFMGR